MTFLDCGESTVETGVEASVFRKAPLSQHRALQPSSASGFLMGPGSSGSPSEMKAQVFFQGLPVSSPGTPHAFLRHTAAVSRNKGC